MATSADEQEKQKGEGEGKAGITEKLLEVQDFYFFIRPLREEPRRKASLDRVSREGAVVEAVRGADGVDAEWQIIKPVHLTINFVINDEHQLQAPQFYLNVQVDGLVSGG